MGEIAGAILDGTFCEGCGEVFDDVINGDDPPGYVRLCPACSQAEAGNSRRIRSKHKRAWRNR